MIHPRNRIHVDSAVHLAQAKYGIRVYRYANVGNHLHFVIQARKKAAFQAFLREVSGRVAMIVTGARKGLSEKFWDHLAFTRVVNWGRDFEHVCREYLTLNLLESFGWKRPPKSSRKTRAGPGKTRRPGQSTSPIRK